MFLQPRKTKYKKLQKGRLKRHECHKSELSVGTFGLKVSQSGLISAKQLESARQAIMRRTGKKGKMWVKTFPFLPITKKPNETRMGKGKGTVQYWASRVRGGKIIFELTGLPRKVAIAAFKTGSAKLPLKTAVVVNRKRECSSTR